MNVYDFDGTIYDGDCTVDFYFYCLRKHPIIIYYIVRQAKGFILYGAKKIDKTRLKEYFFSFLNGLSDTNLLVLSFWQKYDVKIRQWYIQNKNNDDIIISASPEFLLMPLKESLNIKDIIATKIDIQNGHIEGTNCFGEEKILRFMKKYPSQTIDRFFSDSNCDLPLAKKAKKAYKVGKEKISIWNLAK
ncbi:MAG: HAD-IB family phosphatase [Eubacteriales bacterium]|nr:HAD-IB family phosphatase [Eubacteriales bacterium]